MFLSGFVELSLRHNCTTQDVAGAYRPEVYRAGHLAVVYADKLWRAVSSQLIRVAAVFHNLAVAEFARIHVI